MNSIQRTFTLAALSAVVAAGALALPSVEKRAWADGPVQFIMTQEELAAFRQLPDDAAADEFVALFWARRDPTPATPRNEFHEDFDARVTFTDQQFGTKSEKGSMTDRGKTFILFGQPLKALNLIPPPQATGDAAHEGDARMLRQAWIYEGPNATKLFNIPHVEIVFVDRIGMGDYRIEMGHVDVPGATRRVIQANITQPQLTKVPVFEAPKPVQAAVAAPAAAVAEAIHTAALQAAIDAAKAKPAPSPAQFSYAEFVSSGGDDFIPLAVTVPASANVPGDTPATIFGEVVNAAGEKVAAFERETKPVAEKNGWFIGHSVALPTGKYTAYVGVARAGQPLLMTSGPVEAVTVTKEAIGTSKLVLWSDAQILKEQLPDKAPYAFGNLQLIPNPTLSFTNQDELGYFVEINNPGLDATSQQPKIQMSMELQSEGKPISRQPLSEAQVLPFGDKAVTRYVIVNSIPLSKLSKPLAPGSYTLKMKVLDTVTKQSYTLQENFKITS